MPELGAPKSTETREEILAELLAECMAKLHAGERVDLETICRKHPDLAEEMRRLLPAMDVLLDLKNSGPAGVGGRPPAETDLGHTLGDYRILRELGRGGMGVVYEAEQISLGRRVALKVLPFAAVLDARHIQRFKNEAQAAAHLHHRNIVPVYGVGCDRGVHYFAMQYIEGQSVEAVIRELRATVRAGGPGRAAASGPLSKATAAVAAARFAPPEGTPAHGAADNSPMGGAPRTTDPEREVRPSDIPGVATPGGSTRHRVYFRSLAALGLQAAEALDHAHEMGVIHRDIKPSNLLLDDRGTLWMADFGLARIRSDSSLTLSGDLLGTLRYMSPEQALGKRLLVDHRTDIYSLGATLYELLTLEPAFHGADREEILRQIAFEDPRPLRAIEKAVPAELETIVLKAMAKNPVERYGTAQALADDLRRFLEDRPILARRPSFPERVMKWSRRHPAAVWATGVVLLLAVAGLAIGSALLWQEEAETKTALGTAERNLNEAKRERNRAQSLLARSQIEHGLQLLEAENLLGLLDLVEARTTAAEQPGLRDVAGWLLSMWLEAHPSRLVEVLGHKGGGRVQSLAFSPDGTLLAAASEDPNAAQLWNVRSGLPHGTPLAHAERVTAVVFRPDGLILATSSWDGTVRLWDAASCAPCGSFLRHGSQPVFNLAFSPDGRLIASASEMAGTIKLWNSESGEPVGRTIEHPFVWWLAFSPDGAILGAGSTKGKAQLWYTATQEPCGPPLGDGDGDQNVFMSRSGDFVAVASDGRAQVYGLPAGEPRGATMEYGTGLYDPALSPDDQLLAIPQKDKSVSLWETASGNPHGKPFHVECNAFQLAFHPGGKLLAAACCDGNTVLWETESRRTRGGPLRHEREVNAVTFSPGGELLATASRDGNVRLWKVEDEGALQVSSSQGKIACAAMQAERDLLVTGSLGGVLETWDIRNGKRLAELARYPGSIYRVSLRPDGGMLIAGRSKEGKPFGALHPGIMRVFDPRSSPPWRSLALSPGGSLMALAFFDSTIWLWDAGAAELRDKPLRNTDEADALCFSPDGRLLASSGRAGVVELWKTESGEPSGPPLPVKSWTVSLAFSPDGKLIASGSLAGEVLLWDIERRTRVEGPLVHKGAIRALAFSPDGSLLAVGCEEASPRLWNLTTTSILPRQSVPLTFGAAVSGFTFHPAGELGAVVLTDGSVRLWPVPSVSENARELELRAWMATGARRDEEGNVEVLSGSEWQELRKELHSLTAE